MINGSLFKTMIFSKIKNYRFPFWITVFLFFLVMIPYSIYLDYIIYAKIFGILLVLSLFIALKFWFAVARNRNNVVSRVVLNRNDIFDISRDFSSFSSLDEKSKKVIINRVGILLARVKFINSKLGLLEKRESIQLAVVYVCENWIDEFEVHGDWVFQLSDFSGEASNQVEYFLTINQLEEKRSNLTIPQM